MWQDAWAAGGLAHLLAVIAWIVYKFHVDAVQAERRRADDARAGREAAERRADLREDQMGVLMGRGRDREPSP